jgi:signal transduction histidine kinase
MANEPDYELFLRILRGLQAGQAELKQAIAGVSESVLAIRNQLHAMQGDGLRQEHLIAGLRVDVDRIKARLEIADTNA